MTRRASRRAGRFGALAAAVLALVALAVGCQPLPPTWTLTGPGPTFGNVVTSLDNPATPTCPNFQPGTGTCPAPSFWASINGPYAPFSNGDPYATKCAGNTGTPAACDDAAAANGATNPLYRPAYRYALDISEADAAAGTPISFWAYDLSSSPRTVGTTAGVDCRTTVAPYNQPRFSGLSSTMCQAGDLNAVNTDVQVYDNDGDPKIVSYSTPLADCHRTVRSTDDATPYKNRWAKLCTIDAPRAGTYPVNVSSSGIAGVTDSGTGLNNFSLALAGAPTSAIHALDEVSVNFNELANEVRVADVSAIHRGRKLRVDLFDAGDSVGTTNIQLLAPPAGPRTGAGDEVVVPADGVATACSYNATGSATIYSGTPPDSAASCTVTTTAAGSVRYNGTWLRIEVQLDPAYTCGTTGGDCWWTLRYQTTSPVSDRVVFKVSVA